MLALNLKLTKRFRGRKHSALRAPHSASGFTLIELVVTLVILSILTLGTIPLMQNAVRRQKEQRLRETLRDIRQAIDEFKRDAAGSCVGSMAGGGVGPQVPVFNQGAGFDPRTRVMITDCEIFEVENLDRYPPSLEVLVEGVMVRPRAGQALGPGGQGGIGLGNTNRSYSDVAKLDATDEKKKVYLREMPIDPITGESDWQIRSCYQDKDATDWDNINVFDVRSSADGEALDGTKYSDF
ncbi:MAG: type II secretion system GspH family protein [Acidobacteriota bacterium]|nr:type II secretion system GspH family protein [Acidobacteriota bacterium]